LPYPIGKLHRLKKTKQTFRHRETKTAVLQKISLERTEHEDPSFLLSLGCHSKQAGDEGDLTSEVAFGHALHLPLADHVHALVPLERSVYGLERKETHPWFDQPGKCPSK